MIRYSRQSTDIVDTHLAHALDGLPVDASLYDRAAALNAYTHLLLKRTNGSVASKAEDVLRSGEAVCGGMALVLCELLARIGVETEYAYTHGGLAAHSMVEAIFSSGTHGLFDPYHGTSYYSERLGRPLSILTIEEHFNDDPQPVFYVRRNADIKAPLTRQNAYSATDEDQRTDYAFPDIFVQADGLGLANSGMVTFIDLELAPGEALGNATWTSTNTPVEPRPWTRLSQLRRSDDRYISWAYLLGQTSLGYHINHAYRVRELTRGQGYRLQVQIANAYPADGTRSGAPHLTLHPTAPAGRSKHYPLAVSAFSSASAYRPQIANFDFTATSEECCIIAAASGDLVLQSLAIYEHQARADR